MTGPDDISDRLLQQSAWWHSLAASQQEKVRAELLTKVFPTNAAVCIKGDPVDFWPGVASGLLKICTTDIHGRAATLMGVPSGGWFGEGSLLKNEPRRYDAIALRESTVVMMTRSCFSWLLDNSIGFNRFILLQINERLGQFIGSVEYQRLLTPEGRLARTLAQMFNPLLFPGVDLTLSFSQLELGQLSGLSRQRINQALRELEEAGLIEVQYGSVVVKSVEGLRYYPEDIPSG
ncbi:MAG: Crp/Fnr family transcriptional regulator [Burkholderiaceae bacterium]